jgi:hypothetical protein
VRFREWNRQRFARDQIRGLVRQVFMHNVPQPVRQVAFSAAGPEIEIGDICLLVGKALIEEREGEVAIVRTGPGLPQRGQESLKATAIPLERKLWLLQEKQCSGNLAPAGELYSYLGAVRAEFEYSIVLANPADSNAIVEGGAILRRARAGCVGVAYAEAGSPPDQTRTLEEAE